MNKTLAAGLSVCQVFQTEVFPEFLKGNSKEEAGKFFSHRPGGLRTAPVINFKSLNGIKV